MNLIKTLIRPPILMENGEVLEYEQISINYKGGEGWCFSVKINGNWHDIITSDDMTELNLD